MATSRSLGGTIESVNGDTMQVKSRSGEDVKLHVAPDVSVSGITKISLADIKVGSFYDPALDEGCAFEELISFHGRIGGPQTRTFLLYPAVLPLADAPITGAAAVHEQLSSWRRLLNGADTLPAAREAPRATAQLVETSGE